MATHIARQPGKLAAERHERRHDCKRARPAITGLHRHRRTTAAVAPSRASSAVSPRTPARRACGARPFRRSSRRVCSISERMLSCTVLGLSISSIKARYSSIGDGFMRFLLFYQRLELGAGTTQAASHRRGPTLRDLGDLLGRIPFHIVQMHHRAILGRKGVENPPHLVRHQRGRCRGRFGKQRFIIGKEVGSDGATRYGEAGCTG